MWQSCGEAVPLCRLKIIIESGREMSHIKIYLLYAEKSHTKCKDRTRTVTTPHTNCRTYLIDRDEVGEKESTRKSNYVRNQLTLLCICYLPYLTQENIEIS